MTFKLLAAGAVLAIGLCAGPAAAQVASVAVAPGQAPATSVFLNAKPLALPKAAGLSPAVMSRSLGGAKRSTSGPPPGRTAGSAGGPVQSAIQIVPDTAASPPARPPGAGGFAIGQSGLPFSTSRVELSPTAATTTNLYPFRATGRLGFRYANQNAWCSAALIDKGLLLTAAHCVAEYGSGRFLPNAQWSFIPGFFKGKGAYGTYAAQAVYAPESYLNGTDGCLDGVVCPNDVAIIVLRPDSKRRQPGTVVGWFGTGWDGYGFSDGVTQVGQLGYPGGIDSGTQMIRNDSLGFTEDIDESGVINTLIASPLDGGSSGGPWTTNLGIPPVYNAVAAGSDAQPNTIIGVTSWGFTDGGSYAVMGASPLTSGNLVALRTSACAAYPAACTNTK